MGAYLVALLEAAAAFAATNVDDLVLLTLYFSQVTRTFGARHIVGGQLLGFSALVAVSLPGFAAGQVFPREWLGLFGLVPIALGMRAWRAREDTGKADSTRIGLMGVAQVTFANGSDNVGVYAPLFATLGIVELGITLAVFYAMLLAWCAAGRRLAMQPHVAAMLARRGHELVPFVLVAIGLAILAESGTWRLLVG